MEISWFKTANRGHNSLKYRFLIISSLIFVLPVLILFYLFYQSDTVFDFLHLLILTFILLLVLAGMMAMRFIFDRVFHVADSLKKASESGKALSTNLKKDVTELDDILVSFNSLLQKFEKEADQATQRTLELSALKDIGETIIKKTDVDELLMAFLDKALSMTTAQKGSMFVIEPDNESLRLIGSRGIEHLEKGARIKISETLLKHVISEKKPLLVQNIENDPRVQKKNDPKYGTASFLSLPISMGRGDITAVLNLSNKKTGEIFDINDENALSVMEVEIRFTLENALLQAKIEEYIKNIEERNARLEKEIAIRIQAEEAQQKLHEELVEAEKRAALGTCAAGIAHEVKNPLAIIIQGVEYLKSTVGSDTTLSDVTERIKRSALRADDIIKGLLSFTRQTPIQVEDVEITPIIEETLSFVEHQIESKHIRINRQYAPDLPDVRVDSNQIKQVFVNLLLNSVEAMQDGGTIIISTEATRDERDKRCLQVSIADTGCGIPENKIDKVFDPFYTTKDTPGNAGLGLSVTKGIIDKHHGRIRIESEADKGTRVIVSLPAGNAR